MGRGPPHRLSTELDGVSGGKGGTKDKLEILMKLRNVDF